MKKTKPIIVILFCFILCFFISSCSKDDIGVIENVDIASSEKLQSIEDDVIDRDVHFSPLENNLGLTFNTYKNDYINLTIPYPQYFQFSVKDDTHLELINLDNPTLYGCNIKIFFDPALIANRDYDNMLPDATHCIDCLKPQLEKTKYNLEGKKDWQEPELDYSKIYSDPVWSNGYGQYLFHIIKDNANIKDIFTGQHPTKNYVSAKYFLVWNNHPIVISGIALQNDKDKLTSLLDYMVSNISYPKKQITRWQQVGFEKDSLRFSLPKDFSIVCNSRVAGSTSGVQYIVPIDKGSKFSNMAFSLYKFDKKEWDKIDKNYLSNNNYGYQFFEAVCLENSSDFYPDFFTYNPEKKKFGNLNSKMFSGWTCIESRYPESHSFYDTQSDICHSINKIHYGDNYYLAVFTYGINKYQIAEMLMKQIH